MASLKFLILAAACVGVAMAYSSGAPPKACEKLAPLHGVDPQSSPVPYTVSLDSQKVARGQPLTVTVTGNGPQDKIQGFMFQARDGQTTLGSFRVVDKLNSQATQCKTTADTITHKKINDNGISSVSFMWIAPNDFQGRVQFTGTVALNGGVFWTNVQSPSVAVV